MTEFMWSFPLKICQQKTLAMSMAVSCDTHNGLYDCIEQKFRVNSDGEMSEIGKSVRYAYAI